MAKYTIEGNIDFYGELYKSLDENSTINDEDLCLITNLPLTNNYVTLDCKHKFNYIPLFKDMVNRKNKLSAMDIQTLKMNEIRCPYCRNKEGKLLPYYDDMGVEKVHGVNYIDNTKVHFKIDNLNYVLGECSYKETLSDPANTAPGCFCNYVTLYTDGKYYCSTHKRIVDKKILKEKIMEKREAEKKLKLEARLKEKQEKMQMKNEAKQKLKEEKKKQNENVVLFSPNGCKQILKTGLRKGEMCGCKIVNGEFCTRHTKKELITII